MKKRLKTYGHVGGAGAVVEKCLPTVSRVEAAAGVVKKRILTGGRVVGARYFSRKYTERCKTGGRVVVAAGEKKRILTRGPYC